jgi:hypothetical protein
MDQTMQKILELAIKAPSGDNCQPWLFKVKDKNHFDLYNNPDADTSYYNHNQRAALMAHGALLENVSVSAPGFGYHAHFDLLPMKSDANFIAKVVLEDCHLRENLLAPYVDKRCTNRKTYLKNGIDQSDLKSLAENCNDFENISLYLFNGRNDVENLAKIICIGDQLVFENQLLHDFLFEHIRWSDNEALATRDGLDIKTLELSNFDALGFRLLKNWRLTRLLGKLGMTKAVAHNAYKLARSASAIGFILGSESQNPLTHLNGGRIFQRVWLHATQMGLSFHPMAGIAFLMQRVAEKQADGLASSHRELLETARNQILKLAGTAEMNVLTLFRVGYSDPPTTFAQRKDLSKFLI